MNRLHDAEMLPALIVSSTDHRRLMNLADAVEDRVPDVADVLRAELERAQVVAAGDVPTDVVRMGSIVEYSSDVDRRRRVELVFPGDADIAEGRISILTPIGAALIGLAPGQSIAWTARDGRRHSLTVLSVEPPVAAPVDASASVVPLDNRRRGLDGVAPARPDGDDPGPRAA